MTTTTHPVVRSNVRTGAIVARTDVTRSVRRGTGRDPWDGSTVVPMPTRPPVPGAPVVDVANATTPADVPVGTPAAIRLYTDTRAAVVVRTSPASIVVARVEVGTSYPDTRCDVGAYGVRPMRADGDVTKIIPGTEQRFTYRRGAWRNGSIRVTLGASFDWVDYRF